MRIAIGIVVHNGLEFVRPCLESVIKHSPGVHILVMDSGSDDGHTGGYLLNHYALDENRPDNVSLSLGRTNVGYAAAQNTAWDLASADPSLEFFVALNSDIEVLADDWLDPMLDAFSREQKLALCGVAGAPSELDTQGCGRRGHRVEYVEGSCLMARASVLREHGFFDSAYEFAYCEDSDLSLRLRSKGYHIALVDVPIKHLGGATAKNLSAEEAERLASAHAHNHAIVRARWGSYLQSTERRLPAELAEAQNDCLISVVIPVRAGGNPEITLRSLAQQGFQRFRVVISADPDGRGAAWARNQGFRLVDTPYVVFSDDDIEWEPWALGDLLWALEAHPDASYAYGWYEMGGVTYCEQPWSPGALLTRNCASTMSLIRSRDFPGFDEDFKRLQDWDLWLTLLDRGKTGVYCGRRIFTTAVRDGMTHGPQAESYDAALEHLKAKHGIGHGT